MGNNALPLSIVCLTAGDNIDYLQQTLSSIKRNTSYDHEVVLVINGNCSRSKMVAEIHGVDKVIELGSNKGFSWGMNAGFDQASGEYLVGINDDVIVTPRWDFELRKALDTFHKNNPYPRAGLVGPCTNRAGGMQGISVSGLSPHNVEDYSQKFKAENEDSVYCTTFVSGFCFMMHRDFYEECIKKDGYFFDHSSYPLGGADDNDLCTRAIFRGWSPVVAGSVFVWHYGGKTFDRLAPHMNHGLRNLINYYRKWLSNRSEVLGALYRVRFVKDYQIDWFIKSVEKSKTFADKIYILDDKSDESLWPYEYLDSLTLPLEVVREEKRRLEGEQRQALYEMARDDGCDWAISIDADEVFEDKFDRSYVERLMNPPNPTICGYAFTWYNFWNSEKYWRQDDVWGGMFGGRLVRCLPNFKIPSRAFHVGNIPRTPLGSERMTSVRIKHYGNMLAEERQRKYEYYETHDVEKDPSLIGHDDYSHLIDETEMKLVRWKENNSISLCTIMKNEETRLHDYLSRYWPFADEVVLVDTGSTDKSVEVSELWKAKVYPFEWVDDFSKARNFAIDKCSKDWILHLDIDEVLEDLPQVRRMVEMPGPDGFMFYVHNVLPTGSVAITETVRILKNHGKFYYTGLVHETVDEATKRSKLKIARSSSRIKHMGFLSDKSKMKDKLKYYLKLNLRQLMQDPKDARAYYNAALHFLEAGYRDVAQYLLYKASKLDPTFYQPLQEIGHMRAEESYACYKKLLSVMNERHAMYDIFKKDSEALRSVIQEREPLDQTHVNEVLLDPEFRPFCERLATLAERDV